MAFRITNNHSVIRQWIEENGGKPAVLKGAADAVNSLSIQFTNSSDFEPISWEEFFDMFETARLSFRYESDAKPDNQPAKFNFVSREAAPPPDNRDLLLPEDNEMLENNMYPSAPDEEESGTQ